MPARKFSPGQVLKIRTYALNTKLQYDSGALPYKGYRKKMGELAQRYFITHSHLSKIINYKIYKDLSDD